LHSQPTPVARTSTPKRDNTLPPHLSTAGFPRKTGNPYDIFGITYYPLADVSPDYVEYGIASWYGDDFHGKKTANGEVYNMHDMTGAHRVLPLPTFVRVENLENGKETIVRLKDRGPFAKERIIDLSYAAAKEIDMIHHGTARVRITVLSEASDHLRTENKDVDIDKGVFLVQIGSFADKNNAHRHSAGFSNSSIQEVKINGQEFYRVQLKYASRHEAEAAALSLERSYPGAFVIAE
jgi:rare lipoprotein A